MKRAMILVVLLAATSVFANERTYDRSFNIKAAAELALDCHKGNIQIRTHELPVISVKARIYPDQGLSPELVDLTEINAQSGDDWVSIDVEYKQPDKRLSDLLGKQRTLPMIDFDIHVPVDAALKLSSHKASFDVQAGAGKIEVESHKGHGTIRNVRSDLQLETHKGDFKVEVLKLSNLTLTTHKGHIESDIHGANDFVIRGNSHAGKLLFEGRDVTLERHNNHLSVDHREGKGSNRIELSTHTGVINLRFQ